VLFVVKVDVDDFDVGCWIGKDFGVDIVVWEFVLLRECPFDGEVVEIFEKSIIRGFSIMNGLD